MVAPREEGKKPIIIINAEGCPLVPSWNQWLSTLKWHTLAWLDLAKSIDCQYEERLEKVKDNLAKQFEYTKLGYSYEHMWMTTNRILKTWRSKWLKIHESGLGLCTYDVWCLVSECDIIIVYMWRMIRWSPIKMFICRCFNLKWLRFMALWAGGPRHDNYTPTNWEALTKY